MVHPDAAALESIATNLTLLVERIAAIAEHHRDDPDDPVTAPLDDLERALTSANRRLTRLLRTLDP